MIKDPKTLEEAVQNANEALKAFANAVKNSFNGDINKIKKLFKRGKR